MTISFAITTMTGGFIFPFVVQMIWGKMVEKWDAIGGWMAAAFIVGTVWMINHGLTQALIYQTGAWIDQAWAVGIGVFTGSVVMGAKVKKSSLINIAAAVIGGVLGGFLLSLFL